MTGLSPRNPTADSNVPPAKTCWVVSDGRRGIENQALGLAEALNLPITIKRVRPQAPWRWLPAELYPLLQTITSSKPVFATRDDKFEPPWPDVLVATGRASVPYALAIKSLSGGKTFTVQTQNPRVSPRHFDMVVPPLHDGLSADNVVSTIGSPNRINERTLAAEAKIWSRRLSHLPRPLVAVLIGGSSKAHSMTPAWMKSFSQSLDEMAQANRIGLAVTPSRRTGDKNVQILQNTLSTDYAYIWDGGGDNPYFGLLGLADFLVVTSDSTNMVTEAATTGKPIYVAEVPGGSRKFRDFHNDLIQRGYTRPFTGDLRFWRYDPLNETNRIANLIRAKLDL